MQQRMNLVSKASGLVCPALATLWLASAPAYAETPASSVESPVPVLPEPVLPEQLQWQSPPQIPGAQISWVVGAEKAPAPYVFRVKLANGTKVHPHTHPDTRITTVLSGTLYVGFGTAFDEVKVVAIPTGAVYIAPANVPHFIWAKEGMVSYQENGVGPTGTGAIR